MSPPVAILLVDDVEENLIALEALLRSDRWTVHRASTGREALELLLAHDFALALIDVHMPEMDGLELAELMRGAERTRHVPIVFVTANYDEPHRIFQGYDAGAVDFLVKPVEPRILRHKVETFVALCEQRQQLAETLRFHELFVASLGHDLRGPLSAIRTGTGLLARLPLPPRAGTVVERIDRSVGRMTEMIDQLYDLARARLGGGLVLERSRVDLGETVREVARELEAGSKRAVIEIQVEGDATGHWDGVRLARVASNLLANATQHGTTGVPVRAEVDGRQADRVFLRVSNDGMIAADVQKAMFEPFRRGAANAPGLGLGLYIVREVVVAHGGEITVESSRDRGTTFAMVLPRPAP